MTRVSNDNDLEFIDAQERKIEALKFQLKLGLTTVDELMLSIEGLLPEKEGEAIEVPMSYQHAVFWTGDADTLIKG
tara:strand:- start:117 stop:344 length:228 start_codon:yes stop_codon:yes gene_type:complete